MKTERLSFYLQSFIDDSIRTREKITFEMTENVKAEYCLRWLDGAYQDVYMGLLAEELLEKIRTAKPLEVRAVVELTYESVLDQLRRWYPESSTSNSSRMCNLEKHEALRRFAEKLNYIVEDYKEKADVS